MFAQTTDGDSEEDTLLYGVRRGSVLGPTLFNAVMAQLPLELLSNVNCSMCADGVCIGLPVHPIPLFTTRRKKT